MMEDLPPLTFFSPREYQIPVLKALDEGCKRAVIVWHRRAGKELVCWNHMVRKAATHRRGTYLYYFPNSRLGRRILWDGADKNGKRFRDYIHPGLLAKPPNSVEMKIELINGSIIQIMGTDNIINVGINPVGCVFSEFSLQDPNAWELTKPILRENGGWAVFNFTPRGKNHAYDLYQMALREESWFCQRLTIEDTKVITEEQIESERREGMSEQKIQQEYYCSFDQGVEGAVYAKLLDVAQRQRRVCFVPYDPSTVVDTFWDLGVGDATAIIFAQRVGNEIHIIDTYQNSGEGLSHYSYILKKLAEENEWTYGNHWAPHDIQVRELSYGGETRLQRARELGIDFELVPNLPISEGLEMAKNFFPKLWIDEERNTFFLKCLDNYHFPFNEKFNTYGEKPVHDWSSHMMDAFRYLAVVYNEKRQGHMSEEEAKKMERKYVRRRAYD